MYVCVVLTEVCQHFKLLKHTCLRRVMFKKSTRRLRGEFEMVHS